MDLWDTAGQEQYRAIGRHFYKESYIVCLVYDITNHKSFENLQSIWYPELLEYGEKYKIIALIGNKIDKYLEEAVSEEEGAQFSKKIGAIFKRTSALNGTGLDDLFNLLVEKYLKDMGDNLIDNKKDKKNIKINKEQQKNKKRAKFC